MVDAAEARLLTDALAVAPRLNFHDVAADGDCLYRAVACQLETGEQHSKPPCSSQVNV